MVVTIENISHLSLKLGLGLRLAIRIKIPWQIYILFSSHFESRDIIKYGIEPLIEGKWDTSNTWDAHLTNGRTHYITLHCQLKKRHISLVYMCNFLFSVLNLVACSQWFCCVRIWIFLKLKLFCILSMSNCLMYRIVTTKNYFMPNKHLPMCFILYVSIISYIRFPIFQCPLVSLHGSWKFKKHLKDLINKNVFASSQNAASSIWGLYNPFLYYVLRYL